MTPHSQSFLHTRILPTMLSQIPWSMLNGTTCPKSQPAILDQTIFKLRIFNLKTFSYKVQCSKDIIFTVITSAQTRVSVLNSHKFDKNMGFFISKKKKKKGNHHPESKCCQYSQPSPISHTVQRLRTRATTGSHEDKEPHPSQQLFTQWSLFKPHQVFELQP